MIRANRDKRIWLAVFIGATALFVMLSIGVILFALMLKYVLFGICLALAIASVNFIPFAYNSFYKCGVCAEIAEIVERGERELSVISDMTGITVAALPIYIEQCIEHYYLSLLYIKGGQLIDFELKI